MTLGRSLVPGDLVNLRGTGYDILLNSNPGDRLCAGQTGLVLSVRSVDPDVAWRPDAALLLVGMRLVRLDSGGARALWCHRRS